MHGLKPRVLVADDQEDVRIALTLLLKGEGFDVKTVDSPAAALDALDGERFDAALVDLNYTRDTTSGAEGLDLLRHAAAAHPALPLLVMTAWGTLELAVAAMKRGARDLVLKPWDNGALIGSLRAQLGGAPRAAQDVELARRVQRELLPRRQPSLASLALAARCVQAGAVGGDAYDFIELPGRRLAIVLADASGKGMPAALLMAHLIGCLRSEASRGAAAPLAMLRSINRQFLAATAPEHYATLFFGVYDEALRELVYVNCGHNPPLLLRDDGRLERLEPTAPVLGLLEDWNGAAGAARLAAGDTLLAYSDGLSDACPPGGDEPFGEARLVRALREGASLAAPALADAILAEVERFAGAEPGDDRTLIVGRGC